MANSEDFDPKGRAVDADTKAALCARLATAWLQVPQLRLGQLIENAVSERFHLHGTDQIHRCVFYVEDVDLVEACERYAAEHGR